MNTRWRLFNRIAIVVIFIAIFSLIPSNSTQALMGTSKCYDKIVTYDKKGKKTTTKVWTMAYEGYFTGNCASKPWNKQGNVINGGISSSINTADELISKMHDWYNGGGQNKVGAAFIVKTMLGKDADGGGKTVTSSEWKDVEARIRALDNSNKINWNTSTDRCNDVNSYYQSENKDDSFYKRDSSCGSDPAIKFNGSDYILDRNCANPIGSLNALPQPDWKVSTSTSVSVGSASPGYTITWTHKVKNEGPDATTSDVKYHYQNHDGLGGGSGSNNTASKNLGKGSSKSFTSTYDITQNDVGNNLCRSTVASPKAWDDDGSTESSTACIYIPYNYVFAPSIGADVGAVETGTPFNVTPSISPNNDPKRTKSQDTQWRITQIVVALGKTVPNPAGGISGGEPCGTFFKALPDASCSYVNSGTSVFNENGGWQSGAMVAANNVITGDYVAGTHICYSFSIQPRASSDGQWAHSQPVCLAIGKKPKVQITGGDLWVKGLIRTSTSDKNLVGVNRRFGSWDEYGVSATGLVSGMASGSAFAGPGLVFDPINSNACVYSQIIFTNAGNSTCTRTSVIGNFVSSHKIPDVAASFVVNTNDATHNLGDSPTIDLSTNNLLGSYRAIGNITITGGGAGKVVNKGQWIVINAPTANVTISGDITYTSELLKSTTDIPQVIIIAKTISISKDVKNIDAWLIALSDGSLGSGEINTCSVVAKDASLDINTCEQSLVVNGPVMADKLYLRRTAGSGTGTDHSGDPSEVFNLRADVYLWALSRADSGSHVQTVHTIELPPRF
ncbi:MAG: hypothetical protein WCH58_04095 [Candidatus Saccharibacteria bacterium]